MSINTQQNMQNTQDILDLIINAGLIQLEEDASFSKQAFHKLKNDIYKSYDVPKPFPSIRILERYDNRVIA
jgi:hypothetical protein